MLHSLGENKGALTRELRGTLLLLNKGQNRIGVTRRKNGKRSRGNLQYRGASTRH